MMRKLVASRKFTMAFRLWALVAGGVVLSTLTTTAVDNASYKDAIAEVQRQIDKEREALSAIQLDISEERRVLRQSLRSLQQDINTAKTESAELEKQVDQITFEIEKSRSKHNESLRQFDRIWESLKFNLREFKELYSLTLPEQNDVERLKETMETSSARGGNFIQFLEALHHHYLNFFKKASGISSVEAEIYNEAGQPMKANILQVGLLGGTYRNEQGAGLIYLKPGSPQLESVGSGLSKHQRRLLTTSSDPTADFVPVLLDLSKGWALRQLGLRKGWREFFHSGGFVMYPLALIAVIALIMVIERSFYYWLFSNSNSKLRRGTLDILKNKNYEEASKIIHSHKGPSKQFWSKSLELLQKKSATIEEAFQHVIIAEIPKIERFLTTLAVFAAICPLLGLLGTVSGMIKTFDVITVFGTGQHGMLSQGISEALVTTQVGLVLAIPILLAHAILSRRSKLTIEDLDQTASIIIDSTRGENKTDVR